MPKRVIRHAVTQPQDPTIRLIALTRNQNTIVDAADYEWLSQWCWHALWNRGTKSFYAVHNEGTKPNRLIVQLPRVLLGLKRGDKREPDHINHDTLDNRRSNLRIVNHAQNSINRRRYISNTSGFKGVSRYRNNGWMAKIGVKGKRIYLGVFPTWDEARDAYCEASERLHGEFAKLD